MTRIETLFVYTAIFLIFLCGYVQIAAPTLGDKPWLLYASRLLLEGKKIYVDIFEVNPPLILWLYIVPVWLARYMPLSEGQVLALLGTLMAVGSSYVSMQVVKLHPAFAGDKKKQWQFAGVLLSTFIITNPIYFADREHLMLMLICPYVLRFMPSLANLAVSRSLRWVIGCMAAVGFCMKPHIALIFVLLQLFYLWRERSLRIAMSIENIIIYTFGGVYLLMIILQSPEYFSIVFPMALATYSAYNKKLPGLVSFGFIALFIFSTTFVDFRLRDTSPYRRDIYYFLFICLAFLLYALSNNGWGYTYNPLSSMLLITTSWVGWEFGFLRRKAEIEGIADVRYSKGSLGCAIVLSANAVVTTIFICYITSSPCFYSPLCNPAGKELVEITREAHSFGTLTIDLHIWSTLSDEAGMPWVTRFNHLWMIPKFLQSDAHFAQQHRWILTYVAGALAEDMNLRKPAIMIVENRSPKSDHDFINIPQYFSVSPEFREAWTHYRFQTILDLCSELPTSASSTNESAPKDACKYTIYRRVE